MGPRHLTRIALLACVLVCLMQTGRAQAPAADIRDVTLVMPLWSDFWQVAQSDFDAQVAELHSRLPASGPYARVGFSGYVWVSMNDPAVDTTSPAAVDAALASTFAQIDSYVSRARAAGIPVALNILTAIRSRTDPVQRASELEDRRNMQWFPDNQSAPTAAVDTLGADLAPVDASIVLTNPNYQPTNNLYLRGTGQSEWITITSTATPAAGGYSYQVTRDVDGSGADGWTAGTMVYGASGWWSYSRYARKARRFEEAYVREIGRYLAATIAAHPDTLVAASGDGEIEMSYDRSSIVNAGYTDASSQLADYSPFAIAEFRDWLTAAGLYAAGQPYAADAYSNASRYGGAGGLAALNADFGTAFTTWSLRYGDWALTDGDLDGAVPLAGGAPPADADTSDPANRHFDAPRLRAPGTAWWDLWDSFRQTMIQHHNTDFAKWITTSADASGNTVPTDRWFSYQIAADYLFRNGPNGIDNYPNFRLTTSASPLRTADIGQYGGMGITAFNSNVGLAYVDGPFYKTLPAVAPVISPMPQNTRWAILEWNPSVPVAPLTSSVYTDEIPIVERYRPAMVTPFLWIGGDATAFIVKDSGFEPALRTLIANVENVPATCSFSLSSSPPPMDSIGGSGTITVTASSRTGAACPWTIASDSPWLTFSGATAATGTDTATVPFDAVGGAAERQATITLSPGAVSTLALATATVTQNAPCSYSLSPASASVGSAASTANTFSIVTTAQCRWAVAPIDSFLRVTSSTSGTGPATVTYSVDANPTINVRPDSFQITGADNQSKTFAVSQAGLPCTFTLTPSSASIAFGGGSGSFDVTTPAGCAWSASASDASVAVTGGASGTDSATVSYSIAQNPRHVSRTASITVAGQTFSITQAKRPAAFAFTSDAIAKLAAFTPGTGAWQIQGLAAQTLGQAGDVPVPGDYNGDGISEIAVYRPSTGMWIHADGTSVPWGLPGDIPVPADYNGDGATERAVFRTNEGIFTRWYVQGQAPISFGLRGDIPVPADFDGDGKADLAVFRPSTAMWYILRSSTGNTIVESHQWGLPGDVPFTGDFDGDGKADLAVFRPSAFGSLIALSTTGYATLYIGGGGPVSIASVPLALDVDNDGTDEVVSFDPASATWQIYNGVTRTVQTPAFGTVGDRAAAARPHLSSAISTDLDGDRRPEIIVFRPSNGYWFVRQSYTNFGGTVISQWGLPGDIPVPGDYEGVGEAGLAIYRPSGGLWFLHSPLFATATYRVEQWGLASDTPVPADYDGDGRTDLAIYRPSTGEWWVRDSSTDYTTWSATQWGLPGDIPLPGDYDGDGRTDFAVYRPSTGEWYVRLSSGGTIVRQWGLPNDVPVPGDYDGDGRTDFAVYRPSEGNWYILNRFSDTFTTQQWGLPGDTPVAGDYDGDGITDVAVYRPSTGEWFVIQSTTHAIFHVQWGLNGDIPIRPIAGG